MYISESIHHDYIFEKSLLKVGLKKKFWEGQIIWLNLPLKFDVDVQIQVEDKVKVLENLNFIGDPMIVAFRGNSCLRPLK